VNQDAIDHGIEVMPRLTRARASDFGLFLAIAAALLGFAAGAALAKDPSGRAEDEMSAAVVPDSAWQGARRGQAEERWSSVADTARDVARYAVDAAREASRATETTLRAMGSVLSEAALVVRRETGRARAAAQRATEAIEEATDQRVPSEVISPRGARSVRRAQAETSFARGSALLEAREYREARDRFAEAVALNPEHDPARAMLAWSQYFLGDFRGAVGSFKTTLARQPTWEGLSNGLGWSRLRIGRYQLAADAFREALDRNPDYVDAWNGLGSALFEGGDYEAALPPLERALDGYRRLTGPEPPEATTLRSKIAWSLYYGERYREALAMFIRASLSAPTSQPLQAGMGWCYLQLGQRADARTAFQRADRLGPNDEIVREGLRRASL
jgi:tetratricopeptide (TPR) repeat protein